MMAFKVTFEKEKPAVATEIFVRRMSLMIREDVDEFVPPIVVVGADGNWGSKVENAATADP